MKILTAILAASLSLAAATGSKAAECKLFGGIGNGLTEDLAKFMADAAVKNVIENNGMKPTGDIKHTCKAATLGSECTARMQGCK
jgi:hypothetical protein